MFTKVFFNRWHSQIKNILFNLLLFVTLVTTFQSCTQKKEYPYPCADNPCNANFWIDTISNPDAYYNENDGYWRVKYSGLNYFTIRAELSKLDDYYVLNKIPLIETKYDSDYWIAFDTLRFTIPLYSYLGWFTDEGLENPIPIGDTTYTITGLTANGSIFNIAGYEITKYTCMDCPYSSTLFGSCSKYTYEPSQHIFFDNKMIGDTAKIFIEVYFNSDVGANVIDKQTMKIIFN